MRPVEVASFLGLNKATVSRYLSDEPGKSREPSEQVLDLFARKLSARDQGEEGEGFRYPESRTEQIIMQDAPEVQAATDQLRELHTGNRAAIEVVTGLLSQLSSKAAYGGKNAARRAAARVKSASPKPKH